MNRTLTALLSLSFATALTFGCAKDADAPSAPAKTDVKVTDIDLGRSLDADLGIKDKTQSFAPNDTVYASIDTKGKSPGTTVSALFKFQDGQVVHRDSIVIAPEGKAHTEFHMQKPDGFPVGNYHVEILIAGDPARSQKFSVK